MKALELTSFYVMPLGWCVSLYVHSYNVYRASIQLLLHTREVSSLSDTMHTLCLSWAWQFSLGNPLGFHAMWEASQDSDMWKWVCWLIGSGAVDTPQGMISRHVLGARVRQPIGVEDCLHFIPLTA
jgi:hypothetical protein